MATTDGAREDSFLSQVERVRREIETHFQRAHELLQQREAELLAELERLACEYSGDGISQQMEELSISKEALREIVSRQMRTKLYLKEVLLLLMHALKNWKLNSRLQRIPTGVYH